MAATRSRVAITTCACIRSRWRSSASLAPSRWTALLHGLVERFLQPGADELDDAAALRAAIGTLADQWQRSGLAEPLPLDLLC